MKNIKMLLVTCMLVIVSGCTSYKSGEVRSSYTPLAINVNESNKEKIVTIKAADGLDIWKVDNKRQVNFIKLMFTGGLDSILLPEGKHSMMATSITGDLRIPLYNYVGGREYFIDYVSKKSGDAKSIYYWVKDVTTDKVVLGREKTIAELKN